MLRRLLARFRHRRAVVPAVVVVDAAAWQQLAELAVVGEAIAVILDAEERWLLLDTEPADDGPWHD